MRQLNCAPSYQARSSRHSKNGRNVWNGELPVGGTTLRGTVLKCKMSNKFFIAKVLSFFEQTSYVELSVRIPTLGRRDSRDSSQCEGLLLPLHSQQSYFSEMESGADYERNENYMHASGAFSVPRQRFIPTVRVK